MLITLLYAPNGCRICDHEEELHCGEDPSQEHCRTFLNNDASLTYCDVHDDIFCAAKLRKPQNTFCSHQPYHPLCKREREASDKPASSYSGYSGTTRSMESVNGAERPQHVGLEIVDVSHAEREETPLNLDLMTSREICDVLPEHPRCRLSFCQFQVGNPACEEYFSSGGLYVSDQGTCNMSDMKRICVWPISKENVMHA